MDQQRNRSQEIATDTELRLRRQRYSKREQRKQRRRRLRTLLAATIATAVITLAMMATTMRWWLPGLPSDYYLAGLIVGPTLLAAIVLVALRRILRVRAREQFELLFCPSCGSENLKRLHRHWPHRLYGAYTGLPQRRYLCADCRWKGMRVDPNRV